VRRRRLADALRLGRFDAGGCRAGAAGLGRGRAAGRRARRGGCRGARAVPPSRQPRATAGRQRAAARTAGDLMSRIAVIGAGGFGTALAVHLSGVGHAVRLWARDAAFAAELQRRRRNEIYLPGIDLPAGVTVTGDLADALDAANFVVTAVPSHGLRAVMARARDHVPPHAIVVSTTKGLEEGTLLRMSELLRDVLGPGLRIAALSGPSFAIEVARGLPTALVVASEDPESVASVQHEFRGPYLRLDGSDDVGGVELGGALESVIAMAAGGVEGMGLGPKAGAARITHGLAEGSRLAGAFGARRDTLAGLAGLGDLVLTCTGALSRNR